MHDKCDLHLKEGGDRDGRACAFLMDWSGFLPVTDKEEEIVDTKPSVVTKALGRLQKRSRMPPLDVES